MQFGNFSGEAIACPDLRGVQYIFHFSNGYGASVIRNGISYGHEKGLYELAVLGLSGDLCYNTPITDDVIGWLKPDEVGEILERIADLPSPINKEET